MLEVLCFQVVRLCDAVLMMFVAPGGSLQQDAGSEDGITRCVVCVFSASDEPAVLKSYYEVITTAYLLAYC